METSIHQFFEQYSNALMTFSAENIAAFYQAPLAVYSDDGIQLVTKESETLKFWEQGVKPYKHAEIERTTFRVVNEERLSKNNFTAKIHWTSYDSAGKEVAEETNFYILTKKDDELKISGLIIMTDL